MPLDLEFEWMGRSACFFLRAAVPDFLVAEAGGFAEVAGSIVSPLSILEKNQVVCSAG